MKKELHNIRKSRLIVISSLLVIIVIILLWKPDVFSYKNSFGFIIRSGDKLINNNKEFRFIGLNTPNLHIEEDNSFLAKGWHRTDEYEIRDIFKTIVEMGGTVTRCYVFSIKGGRNNGNLQSHIYAPRKYDEALFRDFDLMLKVANEYKVRLIVPFIDNWSWWGGTNEFAAFEGKTQAEFCTDIKVKNDFKNFISFVLNRTNTFTGIKYKDDPVILAWETGNELRLENANGNMDVFDQWTKEMAGYIKSIDKNHLVADGASHIISQAQLANPYTDMITEHYYGGDYVANCIKARYICKGKKVFYIGEFNNVDVSVHEQLLKEVIIDGAAGALLWSLRFHTRDGGFYFHGSHTDAFNPCYRWPGFNSASVLNEAKKMKQVRDFAYHIRNMEVPKISVPEPPELIKGSAPNQLRWRGSVGATSYSIEKSADRNKGWVEIDANAMEDAIPYVPYNDKTAVKGVKYFYRVSAKNSAGISKPSNILGPISIN